MEYRDIMLHYYPNLKAKFVDHHFSKIFNYAKTKGEELPIIEPKDIIELDKGNKLEVVEVAPTYVIDELPPQP